MTTAPLTGTQAWASHRGEPVAAAPARTSSLRLIGALARAAAGRVARRGVAGVETLSFAAVTVGMTQLPGAWGDVLPWVVGGLSGLIIADKLSA